MLITDWIVLIALFDANLVAICKYCMTLYEEGKQNVFGCVVGCKDSLVRAAISALI